MYRHFIKRVLDVLLSLIAIIVLLIPMLIIALIIIISDPGPVFFKQKRFGKDKKFFYILKFRTMKVDTPDVPTDKLKNPEKYVTRIGRVLRKTSLDELSEIKIHELRKKENVYLIKPGITGLAQINGRDDLPEKKKAKYDGEYVEKMSFTFDCRCFFGTIVKVFKSEGVKKE